MADSQPGALLPSRTQRGAVSAARWEWIARIAAAVVLVAVAVFVARFAWRDMLLIAWSDPESAHVLLVPIVFAWLAWDRRNRLVGCGVGGRWVGTFAFAAGWALWSVGYRHDYQVFWHGGAVLMALGCFITVVGADVVWRLLPAFGVLAFLVPVPGIGRELIAAPLQRVTAAATQILAEIVGLAVQRTGSSLRINGVDVAIAEACNGMRMAFTLFLACYVFAFVVPLRTPVRIAVLAISPLVAVAANVTRLVPTVWAYAHVPRESAERFHEWAGWAMLVVAFVVLIAFVRLLRWICLSVDPD
jgi:exosortase